MTLPGATALRTDVDRIAIEARPAATRLRLPQARSWGLELDAKFAEIDGGESTVFVGRAFNLGNLTTGLTDPTVRSDSADRIVPKIAVVYNDTPTSTWRLSYSDFSVQTPFGDFFAAGSGGSAIAGTFLESPITADRFTINTIGTSTLFTAAAAIRDVEFKDLQLNREETLVTREKDTLAWRWGVRHMNVDDDLTVFGSSQVLFLNPTTSRASQLSRFDGTGPSVGLTGRRWLGENLELRGSVGASGLVGRVRTRLDQVTTNTVTGTTSVTGVSTDDEGVFAAFDLGSQLVYHWSDDFSLRGGYDITKLFDVVQANTGTGVDRKDLEVHGFRVGLDWRL